MTTHDETQQLVEGASRGDLAAVEGLLARFLPALERYVRRNASATVRARESGSDLVQSVFREVLVRLGTDRFTYRGEAEFKQWLYRAAMLKILSRHRYYTAEKRHGGRESPFDSHADQRAAEALQRHLGSPSDDAQLKEQLDHIRDAFGQLRPNYQEIITLAYVDGLTHREIAERLDIGESHSRVMLSRALARLAALGVSTRRT